MLVILTVLTTGCVKWHSGLDPISPPTTYIIAPTVSSLAPRLEWQRMKPSKNIEDVTYHLVLYNRDQKLQPGQYERIGLTENYHLVETNLNPDSVYIWRVRPEFTKKGKPTSAGWNSQSFISVIPPIFVWWFGMPYSFFTPPAETEQNPPNDGKG